MPAENVKRTLATKARFKTVVEKPGLVEVIWWEALNGVFFATLGRQ